MLPRKKEKDYKHQRNEKRSPSKDELGAFLTLNRFSSPASLSDSLHRLGDDSCGTVYTDLVLTAADLVLVLTAADLVLTAAGPSTLHRLGVDSCRLGVGVDSCRLGVDSCRTVYTTPTWC